MSRLTINDIDSLRASSEPLSTAVAAYASSNSFKSSHSLSKPEAKSLDHHFSVESRSFSGSSLKKQSSRIYKSKVISLGTGRPTADFYPWEFVTFQGSPNHPTRSFGNAITTGPGVRTVMKRGDTYDLAKGLNYGHAAGSQELLRFMTEHVEIVHNPPYRNWGTCLTSGSTSAIEIALRIFCNRGDVILAERFTYPGLIEAANLVGVQTQGVEMDAGGLMSDRLDWILCTWDEARAPKPTILYTIPSGQNPTGATQSLERKKEIYEVAVKHDLIIIEDDPYYFIQMETIPRRVETIESAERDRLLETTTYLLNLQRSFLSVDLSGRVIRLDSTSKILAPGLRAGWVTASNQIIDKFLSYHEVSTVAVSGPTQLMLWNLLDGSWGHLGFFSWLHHLSLEYQSRLNILLKACDSHLPKHVCEWASPQNGMFLWIRINLLDHPLFQLEKQQRTYAFDLATRSLEVETRIASKALENGVQVTKGSLFDTNRRPEVELRFRLTYAAATESELEEGLIKFANTVREEFGLEMV